MALELLVNGILALFFAYCIMNVQATVPASDPGSMGSAVWPTIILSLLVVFLVVNMINTYRSTPAEKRNMSSITDIKIGKIVKSRLFWGMVALAVFSLSLDYIGFMVASFLFCGFFSYLLGEKRPVRLLIFSFFAVIVLYLLFYKGMGVMLPRGKGIFRSFALSVESMLRHLF